MSSEDQLRRLHDQATRGAALSEAERAELEAWYARQDQGEHATLARIPAASPAADLHGQVNAAAAQARTVTERIEQLTSANETLREEIAALQRQLAQRPTVQAR